MPKITPRQAREKQAARLKASTGVIQEQVNNVTEAPGKKAAAKADKMLQNLTNAVTSGKWGANVSAVSVEEWKEAMIKKGIPRIGQGIDAAAAKVENFYDQFFPFLDTVEKEVGNMPDLTLDDNINRAVHAMRRQSEFKYKKGSR